ncbi:MAG: helix-turn-helix domain-containing protein [Colwellia sp.]|nr:helix-turn-helix domain-containing protein [Colwellia sp.]
MMVELNINTDELVKEVTQEVVKQLTPLLKHNSNGNGNEMLTVDELADYLKVTKSFVYERVHKREIPFRKVGRFTRFSKKHIDLWSLNPYHPDLSIYNLKRGKEVRKSERVI